MVQAVFRRRRLLQKRQKRLFHFINRNERSTLYKNFMAKQIGFIKITGCYQHISFYRLYENYYARRKSSLSRSRVKNDLAFRKTREYASWMGTASKIGSAVYRTFCREKRDRKIYQALTGNALQMLKEGFTKKEIHKYLSGRVKEMFCSHL